MILLWLCDCPRWRFLTLRFNWAYKIWVYTAWFGRNLKPHPIHPEHLRAASWLWTFKFHFSNTNQAWPFAGCDQEFPASLADPAPSLAGRGYGCIVPGAAAPPLPLFHPAQLPAAAAASSGQFLAPDPPSAAELRAAEGSPAAPSVCHGTFQHPPVTSGQPEPALHGNRHQLGEFAKGRGWECALGGGKSAWTSPWWGEF